MPHPTDFPWTQADAMYLLLLRRAEELRLLADPAWEEELDLLWNAIDAYEARRWLTACSSGPFHKDVGATKL